MQGAFILPKERVRSMANKKNLIPLSKRTKSERREIAKKGGKKSGEARSRKVELKKVVSDMLNSAVSKYPVLAEIAEKYGLDDSVAIKELISLGAMLKAAADGSASELLKLMEIIGENNGDDQENEQINLTPAVIEVIVEDASGGEE